MADFPLTPDYVITEGVGYKTNIVEFESGKEQRRAQWTSAKRKFHLEFKNRPEADFQTLKTFFDSVMGQYGTFNFTNPIDGNIYVCRFASDTLEATKDTPAAIRSFSCDLIEVW